MTGSSDSMRSTSVDTALAANYQDVLDLPWVWTVDDLELQHHFLTSKELTYRDSKLWREKVPCLAFSNHCVLHLLLAVSALHIAKEKPAESTRYEQLAESHYTIGLRQVMEILPTQNKNYAGALYISTTLVCTYAFAKKPSPGHLLIVADGEEVAWFELLRGVQLVVASMGWDAIFSGVLGPHPDPEEKSFPSTAPTTTRVVHWEPAIQGLANFISTSNDPDKKVYEDMIERISSCFQTTFGTTKEPNLTINGKMEVIIGCIYGIGDEFVLCLKSKKHLALLVLVHFVVLIKTLEWAWYMEGWANHILHGVALILGPKYRDYLRWPTEEIERLHADRYRTTNSQQNM
ncbi:c6 finger domain-containing protein [Colletotrichum incanum]|uniref:C6 finger domain-containing protein n=1 Tax=Colletotrichum incanum TaxID=1573173 RepID=A0A161VPW3_COLIC|nr:c6 finger domain-containing protein [Colletotrichum incanum]